jgi:PAS domain-containing protein
MDLSKLSDSDLLALEAGDISKLSDQGLLEVERQLAPEKETSGLKVFGKRAGLSALPGVGGLAGAEAGAAAGAALGSFFPGPGTAVGGFLGALAGGVGGGMLTGKAQEKALEAMPETRAALGVDPETLAREEEAHGTAAMMGNLAGQAISMRPSVSTIRQAFGKGTAEEVAAARKMMAAGAGVGGGLSAVMQQLENPDADIDWKGIAESTLAGGLFTKPTKRVGEPVSRVARRLAGEKPRVVPPAAEVKPEAPPAEESVIRPPLEGEAAPPPSAEQRPGPSNPIADLIRGELSPAEKAAAKVEEPPTPPTYEEEGVPSWYGEKPTEAAPTEAAPTEAAPVDPKEAAQLSADMAERTAETSRQRALNRIGFPLEDKENSSALEALLNNKHVVVEGFKAFRGTPAGAVHHVYDTEAEALAAAGRMTRKTSEPPSYIDLIKPNGKVIKLDRVRGGQYRESRAKVGRAVEEALVKTQTQQIQNEFASYPENFAKLPRATQLEAFDLVTKDFDPAQREAVTGKLEELGLNDKDTDWLFNKTEEQSAAGAREVPIADVPTVEEGVAGYETSADFEQNTPLRSSTDREIGVRGTTPEERVAPAEAPRTAKDFIDSYGRGESSFDEMVVGLNERGLKNRLLDQVLEFDPRNGHNFSAKTNAERIWKVLEPYYKEGPPTTEAPATKAQPKITFKPKKGAPENLAEAPQKSAAGPRHTFETALSALKKTFGIHTDRLFKNGFLQAVATHADLPEAIRSTTSPTARAVYNPTANKVYFVAENIPVGYNLKGLMAHEVGVHAGMETMLGTPTFEKLLKEVADRAAKGETPFKEAQDRVPSNTPGHHVDEERLAYVISNYKNLPFVKRIYSQLRQWLYRKMGGNFVTLTNDDLNAMALASIKRVSDLAESGRTGELRRDAALAARKERFMGEEAQGEETPKSDAEKNAEDQNRFVREERKKLNRSTFTGRLKNWWEDTKERPYETQVRLFQDSRRKLLTSARALRAIGKIKKDEMDLYDYSTATPSKVEAARTAPKQKDLSDAIADYMARTKQKAEEVLAEFNRWMHGLTEPDLRKWLYTRYVPLSEKPMRGANGKMISPAEAREAMVKAYETVEDLTAPDAKQKYGYNADDIRNYLDYLAKNFAEPNGFTPEDAPLGILSFRPDRGITDINHPAYDLTGVSQEAAARWRAELKERLAGEDGPAIQRVLDAEKALREEIVRLEKLNGHWDNHVDNAIAVMRRGNYYTLKGDANKYNYDIMSGTRLQGALGRVQAEMGGRSSMSDNPLTQTLADSNVALSRLDKKGFLDELYRYAKEGLLKDPDDYNKRVLKVLDPIKVGERKKYELPEGVSPESIVLRPNDKGGYDVIQILNKDWLEPIKGIVTKQSLGMELLGKATQFGASQATRFNIPFAVPNSFRDLATNTSTVSSEYGFKTGAKVALRFFSQAAKGSAFKAAKVANLFAKNDIAEIERLAAKDEFIKNLYTLMKEGGVTAYNTAFSNETATRQLVDTLKKKGPVGSSWESLQHLADVWNNTFEYMNREAAFDTLHQEFGEKGVTRAATETKNLFNPELSGNHTKSLGSWFAFLRASATGAVRQIDSILVPLTMDADTWIRNTYGTKHQRDIKASADKILNPAQLKKAREYWNFRRKNAYLLSIASLGFGMAAQQMAKAVAGTDEKGQNKVSTDNYSLWTRSLRIPTTILGPYAKSLGDNIDFINVPWGYGAGSFAAMGAQIAAMASGDAKPAEAARNMAGVAKDSFLPIPVENWELFNRNPVGGVVASAAPAPLRPVLYFAWNADTFGRQIYSTHQGKYAQSYSGGDYVPEDFKWLSKQLYDQSEGKFDISPQSLQFFANNYISGIATATHAVTGTAQTFMGQKDYDLKTDLPILGSILGHAADADARKFNDTDSDIRKIKTRLSTLRNTGNQKAYEKFVSEHPTAPMLVKQYDVLINRMNKYTKMLNDIRASDMTPKERKDRVEQLRNMRSLYMKQMNDSYELYKERY